MESNSLVDNTLSVRNVAQKLLVIFRHHIGYKDRIAREELFAEVYGYDMNPKNIRDWFRWEFVKRAMHYCRIRTHCFIGFSFDNRQSEFYVLKDDTDAEPYQKILEQNIKNMKLMQKKAMLSIKGEWHKEAWQLPERKKQNLIE